MTGPLDRELSMPLLWTSLRNGSPVSVLWHFGRAEVQRNKKTEKHTQYFIELQVFFVIG